MVKHRKSRKTNRQINKITKRRRRSKKMRIDDDLKVLTGPALVTILYAMYKYNQKKNEEITKDIALNHGYRIKNVEIKGDGSCMYRSIADQLEDNQILYQKYRTIGVEYIRNHVLTNDRLKNNFDETIRADYKIDYETYLDQMENTSRWGDSIMLQAIANALNVRITVINFENYGEGELNPQEQIFNPGMWLFENVANYEANQVVREIAIGYINRNHYISLEKI